MFDVLYCVNIWDNSIPGTAIKDNLTSVSLPRKQESVWFDRSFWVKVITPFSLHLKSIKNYAWTIPIPVSLSRSIVLFGVCIEIVQHTIEIGARSTIELAFFSFFNLFDNLDQIFGSYFNIIGKNKFIDVLSRPHLFGFFIELFFDLL